SVNVCPLSTMRLCGISESEMKPTPTTVAAYDNTRRPCHGTIDVRLELGPLVIPVTFYIVDIDPAYKAILGRTFLSATGAVPSTTHQRMKLKWRNRVVNIKTEPVSVADEPLVNFLPTLWPSSKPVLSTLDINFPWQYTFHSKRVPSRRPVLKKKFASSSRAWHIMINIGYEPSRGLGVELQGNPVPVSDEVKIVKGG